jgi:hypothetical protein
MSQQHPTRIPPHALGAVPAILIAACLSPCAVRSQNVVLTSTPCTAGEYPRARVWVRHHAYLLVVEKDYWASVHEQARWRVWWRGRVSDKTFELFGRSQGPTTETYHTIDIWARASSDSLADSTIADVLMGSSISWQLSHDISDDWPARFTETATTSIRLWQSRDSLPPAAMKGKATDDYVVDSASYDFAARAGLWLP